MSNKKGEDQDFDKKLSEIQERFEKAEQQRSQFKEDFEYDIKLKHEIRRLKEEDKDKLNERNRRQQQNRKLQILFKEKVSESQMRQIKEKEQKLIQMKRDMNIQALIDKEHMKEKFNMVMSKSLPRLDRDA